MVRSAAMVSTIALDMGRSGVGKDPRIRLSFKDLLDMSTCKAKDPETKVTPMISMCFLDDRMTLRPL
jgi:hypothetical protein